MVRAGVVWSGAGTLAVALREGERLRDAACSDTLSTTTQKSWGEGPRAVALRGGERLRDAACSDTLSTTTNKGQTEGYRAWRTAS